MQEFITEADREAISAVVEEVSEWIEYGEGSDDSTKKESFLEMKEKLESAVAVVTDKKTAKENEAKQKESDAKAAAEAEAKKAEDEDKAEEASKDETEAKGDAETNEEAPKSEEGKEL